MKTVSSIEIVYEYAVAMWTEKLSNFRKVLLCSYVASSESVAVTASNPVQQFYIYAQLATEFEESEAACMLGK